MLQLKDLKEKWAVISEQWSVKRRTGVNSPIIQGGPTRPGQAPFRGTEEVNSNSRVVRKDREAADKGRGSFLRQGERQQHYNAKGTGCQRLFSE